MTLRGLFFALASAVSFALLCGAAGAQGHDQRLQQQCLVCHGPQGRSELALTPSLAGQPSFYAITQLFLFREGRRDNVAMTAVAKGMSDADLRGFADAIARLPPPPAPAVSGADPARLARGAALAQKGHCAGCHGADYAGGQQVPRVAHQREDYLRVALQGFRAGTRLGYTNAMGEALAGMTPENLDDLAHYLAYLPAR